MDKFSFKKIELELYEKGFHNFGINCFDEPIAYVSGIFNKKNYYNYIYQYCIRSNWENINFGNNQSKILNELGLNFKEVEYESSKMFLDKLINFLEREIPVVLAVDYYYLFYNSEFYQECHAPHGIIISGLDFKKKIITIRENCHISWNAPYYELNLKLEHFLEILEKSNKYFKNNSYEFYKRISSLYYEKGKEYFFNRFYIIENNKELENKFEDDNYKVTYLIRSLSKGKNNLEIEINQLDYLNKLFNKHNLAVVQFKRNYLETVEVILKIIKNTFLLRSNEEELLKKIIRERSILISKLLMNILRNKKNSDIQIEGLKSDIKKIDKDIFLIINQNRVLLNNVKSEE